MKDSAFLIFNNKGIIRMLKGNAGRPRYASRQRPALAAGEYAVLVTVNVPDAVFKPQPTPEATITVPESGVVAPRVDVLVEVPPDA